MANYVSKYTGAKIDEAVGKALSGTAAVTADSIKTALNYTPADKTVVDGLVTEMKTTLKQADKAAIAQDVMDLINDSSIAHVTVESDKTITLGGDLDDGEYTIKYYNKDGSFTTICTLTISGGTGEGSGGTEEPEEPDTPVVTPTGNLFVASTCTLNKRISSSEAWKTDNATNAFVTDYIDIGDCLASGGTNQIHVRGFLMYKNANDAGEYHDENGKVPVAVGINGTYRGIHYYDSNNNFLGQYTNYYMETEVKDENGDYVITLDASKTEATKIRVQGAIASAALTSTDQLANCKITLNELITD